MDHELILFVDERGRCQVRDYLRTQKKKVRGEAGWLLERLENEGEALRRPIADYLEDGIYELRIIAEGQHRILYFFDRRNIVVTNAFLKKSAKVPKSEIEKAKAARKKWLDRLAPGERE